MHQSAQHRELMHMMQTCMATVGHAQTYENPADVLIDLTAQPKHRRTLMHYSRSSQSRQATQTRREIQGVFHQGLKPPSALTAQAAPWHRQVSGAALLPSAIHVHVRVIYDQLWLLTARSARLVWNAPGHADMFVYFLMSFNSLVCKQPRTPIYPICARTHSYSERIRPVFMKP